GHRSHRRFQQQERVGAGLGVHLGRAQFGPRRGGTAPAPRPLTVARTPRDARTAASEAAVFVGIERVQVHPGSAVVRRTPAPLAKSPSGLKRWRKRSRRRPHLGGLGGGYGTERHTSYGSTVHRAGGPVPERQDDA